MIDAVSHPTRRRILRAFLDDSGRSLSAEELAEAIDQPLAQVGYHLLALVRCEVLSPSQGGERDSAAQPDHRWSLDVEADWLGLVLDVWTESRAAG
jgi:DNA-binding transcriptional ArsR family regulator